MELIDKPVLDPRINSFISYTFWAPLFPQGRYPDS